MIFEVRFGFTGGHVTPNRRFMNQNQNQRYQNLRFKLPGRYNEFVNTVSYQGILNHERSMQKAWGVCRHPFKIPEPKIPEPSTSDAKGLAELKHRMQNK